MSNDEVYLIDTSVWIEAYGPLYPQDVFPGLWSKLRDVAEQQQRIKSPRQVIKELGNPSKNIGAWVKSLKPSISLKETSEVQKHLKSVLAHYPSWMLGPSVDVADPWLIAHGMAHRYVVVTLEKSAPKSKMPKIPDACGSLGVECINAVELFRRLKITLR